MKKQLLTLTTLAILGLSNLLNAQVPNWAWAKSAGGIDYDAGSRVATDASGNVFMTGAFGSDSITFGTITLTNASATGSIFDIFIVKYDASGTVLWAKSAGGTSYDWSASIATDANGNVFMTGSFQSPTITFGTTTLTNAGWGDIFIVKFDASGNVLWANSAGSTSDDFGNSVAIDANGNVFMTGKFNSPTISFGTTTLTNAGGSDIFIVKYNASGNVLWAKSAGSYGDDYGNSVATDASGNVFMTGKFNSPTISFGTTTLTNAGGSDIFIVKYNASGNVLWANSEGGTDDDEGYNVATDANGNVFVTGYFNSQTITFGTTTLTNTGPTGKSDIFIVKYDASGNELWAKHSGGNWNDYGQNVATDASGNVFMTGYFGSSFITFGTTALTSAGNSDIFIVKYDAGGNVIWAKSAGGTDDDFGYGVATDVSGNVLMTGYFGSSSITFGTTTLTNAVSTGWPDIFIAKLDISTGLESSESPIGFSLYPNPANDVLTISNLQFAMGKAVTISINDIAGKVIYNKSSTATEKMEVNTKDFAAGVYLVQVQTNDFVETRR